MNQQEIDIAIAELENRLERLRSLYEQYFMGMERTVPAVAHKDVERRIQLLRRERFQNTARRFKFQTLSQRYNTLQQHWVRVCREIEEGRYKRHRLKAERTVGVLDRVRQDQAEEAEARLRASDATEIAERDLAELVETGSEQDLDHAFERALAATENPAADPQTLQRLRPNRESDTAVSRSPNTAAQRNSSGLLGKLGKRQSDQIPIEEKAQPGSISRNLAHSRPPAAPSSLTSSPGLHSRPVEAPAAPGPRAPAPPPLQRSSPAGSAPTGSAPGAAAPAKPAPGAAISAKPAPGGAAPAKPAPQQPSARAPGAKPAHGPGSAGSGSLSDDRLKDLHQKYLDARKQTNATAVSYEKLAQSIRDTEQKLRAKHKGRNVDFDVLVKDGKAIIKPKLR